MDEKKLPYKFSPDPGLVGIKPLFISSLKKAHSAESESESESDSASKTRKELFHVEDEVPPLNGSFGKFRVNKFRHRQ